MASEQRVLVVEDDPEIGTAMCELLEQEGYSVDLVPNGVEAIHVLDSGHLPGVLLVDLLMPGIVGQELLEYLRADARLAGVPVAIVSGSPQLAPAGYPVFPKPVDLRRLLDFVRQACSASQPARIH